MERRNYLLIEWIAVSAWLAFVTHDLLTELRTNPPGQKDECEDCPPASPDGGGDT